MSFPQFPRPQSAPAALPLLRNAAAPAITQGATASAHAIRPADGRQNPGKGTITRPLIVLGATGTVGQGIVQAAVEAALPVIAVARDPGRLARLKARYAGADLVMLTGAVDDDAGGAALADQLRALDRPAAGVVAAIGAGRRRGRLLDQSVSALRSELDEDLLPHLSAARHLLPLLAEGNCTGSYVLIGGPGSESPWAGYGHRSIAAAAQRMLACVLHDEARALDVRVHLLSVDAPACTDDNRLHACARWPSAVDIGRQALALVQREGIGTSKRAIVPFASPRAAQDPERPFDRKTRSSLNDARALLNSLKSANPNEVSP